MKPSKATVTRTVVLVVALVNQVLASTGHSPLPFDDAELTDIISTGFTVVTALVAWWKNNSFSYAALKGDERMKELRKR